MADKSEKITDKADKGTILMKSGQYGKRAVVALNVLLILFMVYVVTASAGYTVLLGDDYTHGVRVGVFHVPLLQYVAASVRYMKEIYLDWQGTYFAMFLQAFLSPINNFGLGQLRIVMMVNALLFFAALFGVVWVFTGFALRGERASHIRLTVFSVILFSVLDADVFTEIFFWYSGAVSYSIPFSTALLAVLCFLLSNNDSYSDKKRTTLAVMASVLGFLASGGSLAVSGTGCYALVLLTVGFYLVTRKISVRNIMITAAAIVGALVNTIAPGNFSRHTYNSGGDSHAWRLLQSVKWAVKTVWGETGRLTKETMFGVMLLAMILIGIRLSKKLGNTLPSYGMISVLALAAGYVTAFPVALGYGGPEFPNRCYFILDVVLVLSLLNFAFFMGVCLDRWAGLCENRSTLAVLYVVLFAAVLFAPESISDSALIAVAESEHNGSYADYYGQCIEIYDYLEQCTEKDVVVDVPEYIENFECFYLDENPEGWVNVGIAEYYHKNSVRRIAE
ncbi:MAG: hypothetical protein HDR06_04905 [Lachnospiraceae bacterium]|nr:hypothetical protein [Lachnospiraceae bacterium]